MLRADVSAPGPDEVVGQLTRPVRNNPDGAAGAERRMTAQTICRDRSPTEAVEEALAKATAYPDAAVFTELFAKKNESRRTRLGTTVRGPRRQAAPLGDDRCRKRLDQPRGTADDRRKPSPRHPRR